MPTLATRFAALALLACALAAPAEPEKPAKGDADGKALLDGKTLDGWTVTDFGGQGKVHVKDGAVILERGKLMTGITYAGKDFPKIDYDVAFEARKLEGDDFFCTTTFPVGDKFCSLVVGGWGGTVVGLSSVDFADASENETSKSKEFKHNQWYKIRLRVTKAKIEVWIDGEKLIDLETKDRNLSIRIECHPSKPFGICTWNTSGAVRNLKLKAVK